MEISPYLKKEKINGVFGFSFEESKIINLKKTYEDIFVSEYIMNKTQCKESKLYASLQIVHLQKEVVTQKINTLSSSEKMKVELAIALLENRKELFLYKFDSYFMSKELLFFKNLFKRLTTKYKKTIVFIDSNTSYLVDFADIFIINSAKEGVQSFDKDDFYSDKLEEFIELPPIISFVKYVNKNKKYIGKYKTIAELMKAIYREV